MITTAVDTYLMVHELSKVRVLKACILGCLVLKVLLVVDIEKLRGRGRNAASH